MLKIGLSLAQLPARLTLNALRSATSPRAVNALSLAIAQGSLRVADQDETLQIEGASIEIDFNEERLLSTAGFATACGLATAYWIGSKLKMEFRYAAMITALEDLNDALKAGDDVRSAQALERIDDLSNPLIDPETLEIVDEADEVRAIYESLFDRPAQNGSMFNASKFTDEIAESISTGSRVATLAASEATEEVLEEVIKKARPIASTITGRLIGAALFVDTIWWATTSVIDLGLNYTGISEEDQRVPILADIPIIGALFDFSDSVGSSAVDLVLAPIFDGIFSILGLQDEVAELTNTLWTIITSAALTPTVAPFVIALIEFYVDDVDLDFDLPVLFDLQTASDRSFNIFSIFRFDPTDILILWLYAIVIKIFAKAWVIPAFRSLVRNSP